MVKQPSRPRWRRTVRTSFASTSVSAFQKPTLANDDNANRTYKSIEVAAMKRLSDRWQFLGIRLAKDS